MKPLSIIVIGIIFVLSTTGLSWAQEKAKREEAPEVA